VTSGTGEPISSNRPVSARLRSRENPLSGNFACRPAVGQTRPLGMGRLWRGGALLSSRQRGAVCQGVHVEGRRCSSRGADVGYRDGASAGAAWQAEVPTILQAVASVLREQSPLPQVGVIVAFASASLRLFESLRELVDPREELSVARPATWERRRSTVPPGVCPRGNLWVKGRRVLGGDSCIVVTPWSALLLAHCADAAGGLSE